jgi:hypothetical protein
MPRSFKTFRLWIAVLVLSLTGLAALALGAVPAKPIELRAWSSLPAI